MAAADSVARASPLGPEGPRPAQALIPQRGRVWTRASRASSLRMHFEDHGLFGVFEGFEEGLDLGKMNNFLQTLSVTVM